MIGATAFAQDIAIAPKLRAGDEFRVEVVRVRENSSAPQQDGRSRTVVAVRVLSATPEAVTLDWTAGETAIGNSQLAQNPILLAATKAIGDIPLRITLNADGEYTGLVNQAEVASKLQAVMDAMVRQLMEGVPEEQRKGVQALMAQVMSPATLIASATRDAQMFFGLNGVSLVVGEPREADIDQPNPLGGGVLPAKFRIHVESATADSAVVATTTTYDGAALMKMTQALLEQAGKPVPAEERAKLPPIQMADDGRYLFDRTLGLMREVVVNRRITAGAGRRVDAWEIRLLDGPQR